MANAIKNFNFYPILKKSLKKIADHRKTGSPSDFGASGLGNQTGHRFRGCYV